MAPVKKVLQPAHKQEWKKLLFCTDLALFSKKKTYLSLI